MRSISLVVSLVASLAAVLLWAPPGLAAPPEELASLDALYVKRADDAAVKELDASLSKALEAAPQDYELLWRMARILQWQADGSPEKLKKTLARRTWDTADRARAAAPDRVEGQYYAALGIGSYSQAVGILKALGDGLEGKFNERLDAAIRIDSGYERGAPLMVKGRYHYELPWPKRDLKKSAELLQKVTAAHPANLRAWMYLADTLLAQDEPKKAQEAILKVSEGSTAYDPPEGRRVQQQAKAVRTRIEEKL